MIDNFDVAGDDGLADLESLGAQVVLTTRQDFRPHFAQVDLEALEEEDAYRLLLRHASLRKGDREEEVLELVRQVEGHTTAVILLAAQKEADGFTTGQLLDRLKQGLRQAGDSEVQLVKDGKPMKGGKCLPGAVRRAERGGATPGGAEASGQPLLLGPQGIAPGNLCLWCGLPNRNGLNRLVKRHWVEQAEDRVFLSPVIRQVAFETAGVSFAACGPLLKAWNRWYEGLSGGGAVPVAGNAADSGRACMSSGSEWGAWR